MDEARRARNDMEVMRAYQQSAVLHFQSRELDRLDECVRAASNFTRERELHDYLLTHSLERYGGEVMLARGDWQDAIGRFEAIARRETLPWWMRLVLCQLQIALIHARQGKAVDEGCLSESLNRQDELPINNLYVLHRTLAEIAWLRDDRDAGRSSAAIAIDIAIKWGHPWACGEASLWLRLASDDDPPFVADGARIFAEPYSRLFAGEARGASQMWKQRGYRYEEGVALMHGDETDQREAIHLFEALGAKAAAERVRERMRALGLRSIPLGPQASTKANAAGLSDRELEVLVLLADGLTNAEMATRLHRSVRTIENHVAAILAKLDAGSRLNAVTIARKRSLISK